MITKFKLYENISTDREDILSKINSLKFVEYDKDAFLTLVEPPYINMEFDELPQKVQDFIYSDLSDKKFEIKDLKLSDIIISQNILMKERLLYALNGKNENIMVCEYQNKYYLMDGNHRYFIEYFKGTKIISCKVYQID